MQQGTRVLVILAVFAAWTAPGIGQEPITNRLTPITLRSAEIDAPPPLAEDGGNAAHSFDGRWIVFTSSAPNLVLGMSDNRGQSDVFLFDRSSSTTRLVSHRVGRNTVPGNGESRNPSISGDGRWITFSSRATDLVDGFVEGSRENDDEDFGPSLNVYLYDAHEDLVSLVSASTHDPLGGGNGSSSQARISENGQVVWFQSLATDLVEDVSDENSSSDVFVYNRLNSELEVLTTRLGSPAQTADGETLLAHLHFPLVFPTNFHDSLPPTARDTLSVDGRFGLLVTEASDFTSTPIESGRQTVLIDRITNQRYFVAPSPEGHASLGCAAPAKVSDNGRFVAYTQEEPEPTRTAVYLWDRVFDSRALLSRDALGMPVRGCVTSMSADGNRVAINAVDLLIADIDEGEIESINTAFASPSTTYRTFAAAISDGGSRVTFSSPGPDLVEGQIDINAAPDIFVRDLNSDAVELLSGSFDSNVIAANRFSFHPMISGDGSVVSFRSEGTDLEPNFASTGRFALWASQAAGAGGPPAGVESRSASEHRSRRWLSSLAHP